MFERLAERLTRRSASAEDVRFRPLEESVAENLEANNEPVVANTSDTAPSQASIELKVTRPESFADVSGIADFLLEGCTVVLNMELMDKAQGLRMLDFLNGVTYSLGGDIKNVSPGTYIITPNNIDITT